MDVWILGSIEIGDKFRELGSPFVSVNHIIAGFGYPDQLCKISMLPGSMKWHLQFVNVPITPNIDDLFGQASFPGEASQSRA